MTDCHSDTIQVNSKCLFHAVFIDSLTLRNGLGAIYRTRGEPTLQTPSLPCRSGSSVLGYRPEPALPEPDGVGSLTVEMMNETSR
jgi:hypothetical protein